MERPCCSYSCSVTSGGEHCCLAGPCLQIPWCDKYAPNQSCCLCYPPKYEDRVYTFKEFAAEVLPKLHTGDVILTSWARNNFGTGLSRLMMHTRYSHNGIVYRPSDSPILKRRDRVFGEKVDPSRPLLLQMVNGGAVGHREFTEKGGLDLVDCETYLKDYCDKFTTYSAADFPDPSVTEPHIVGARILLGVNRDDAFYKAVEDTVDKYWDIPFDINQDNRTQFDLCQNLPCCFCFQAKADDSALLCSELAAHVYINTGLIGGNLNASEMIPAHWDSTRRLRLLNRVSFSEEHIVAGPATLEQRDGMGYYKIEDPQTRHPISVSFGPGGFGQVDTSMKVPDVQAGTTQYGTLTESPNQQLMNEGS